MKLEEGAKAGFIGGIISGILLAFGYVFFVLPDIINKLTRRYDVASGGMFSIYANINNVYIFYFFGQILNGISLGILFGILFSMSEEYIPVKNNIVKGIFLSTIIWFIIFPFLKYKTFSFLFISFISYTLLGFIVGTLYERKT